MEGTETFARLTRWTEATAMMRGWLQGEAACSFALFDEVLTLHLQFIRLLKKKKTRRGRLGLACAPTAAISEML